MEKQQKTGEKIYGYTVCVVAIITFIISVTMVVDAIMDLGDPIHSVWTQANSPSLASFDNYKMDLLRSVQKGDDGKTYVPDDQTLRAMYESAKSDRIQMATHAAHRSITIGSILIVICVTLFTTHLRWMLKLNKAAIQ